MGELVIDTGLDRFEVDFFAALEVLVALDLQGWELAVGSWLAGSTTRVGILGVDLEERARRNQARKERTAALDASGLFSHGA